MMSESLYLAIPLAPLAAALIAGFGGDWVGRRGAHCITIFAVGLAFALSLIALIEHPAGVVQHIPLYTWLSFGNLQINIGFFIDHLTLCMMLVVTFVSLMVHIYTVGYMRDDPGYRRFFSYISLFTFAMLILVMADNFAMLFFGWEAVGLVSYLLIGFWYNRQSAIRANLKAFLVNRVGDFGFLLGIAAIYYSTGSLDYQTVFAQTAILANQSISILGAELSAATVICLLLFVGAMGKSAQMPLHVWLPDSMEGPTPISALIHAATMVTAGIFMVARMSPMFELSETALSTMLIIGSCTAVLMGLVGLVQNDIKRIVAYSTLSQLGYMTVALGASAYSAAIFHLVTHAFFKALLFLAAGSVIMAMHHEQDIRKMGGLKRYLPITYWVSLIGSLSLAGVPGFSGFFSKHAIVEVVHHTSIFGGQFAYYALNIGILLTALYSARLFFMVFHGENRLSDAQRSHCHESGWVVTLPLMLLAVPSVIIGALLLEPMIYGNFFGQAIFLAPSHDPHLEYHGLLSTVLESLLSTSTLLVLIGLITPGYIYLYRPQIATWFVERCTLIYKLLWNKYYFDEINDYVFARGARGLGNWLWRALDVTIIDRGLVHGLPNRLLAIAAQARTLHTGLLYSYVLVMVLGFIVLCAWMLVRI